MDHRSRPFRSMPSTRWRLVAEAGRVTERRRRRALDTLLARYMPALRAHLVIQRRLPAEQAEDLLQSFVMNRVLERALLERADPSRGRFRNFLLTALDRFVASQVRFEQAGRRAPPPGALEALREQTGPGPQEPGAVYEVEWARQLLDEALRRMLEACRAADRMDLWGVFDCRLLAPILDGVEPASYDELITRFGFETPAQASNALITTKRMFARHLRAVVGEYVRDPDQIEVELRELRGILARGGL